MSAAGSFAHGARACFRMLQGSMPGFRLPFRMGLGMIGNYR
jgi:hypothetical protein